MEQSKIIDTLETYQCSTENIIEGYHGKSFTSAACKPRQTALFASRKSAEPKDA